MRERLNWFKMNSTPMGINADGTLYSKGSKTKPKGLRAKISKLAYNTEGHKTKLKNHRSRAIKHKIKHSRGKPRVELMRDIGKGNSQKRTLGGEYKSADRLKQEYPKEFRDKTSFTQIITGKHLVKWEYSDNPDEVLTAKESLKRGGVNQLWKKEIYQLCRGRK